MGRISVTFGLLFVLFSLILAAGAMGATKAKEGWGSDQSFIGRYKADVTAPGSAGVLGGELTMFIQEEFPGSEAPAGILKLRTKTLNDVVYLKEPKHRGSALSATVKGGSFLGPTIGRFVGKLHAPGRIVAGVSTRSL